jgi:hypothetical protein
MRLHLLGQDSGLDFALRIVKRRHRWVPFTFNNEKFSLCLTRLVHITVTPRIALDRDFFVPS